MKNSFEHIVALEYSQLFDDSPKIETLLQGIGRKRVLQISCFLAGIDSNKSKILDNREFLSMFFSRENQEFVEDVFAKITQIQNEEKVKLTIPYFKSSLYLYEFAITNLESDEEVFSQSEVERNYFKAHLIANEFFTKKMGSFGEVLNSEPDNKELGLAKAYLTASFSDTDLLNFNMKKVMATQIIKSIFLFEWLESEEKGKLLLGSFLEKFDKESWKEYFLELAPLILGVMKNKKEGYLDINLEQNENYDKALSFLTKHSHVEKNLTEEYDFVNTRATPFYMPQPNVFRVVYPLFVLELLHTGVYFKLSELEKNLKVFPNFRSSYCHKFSENTLLYSILNRIFSDRYITYTGDELKTSGLDGEPDYYLRNGNKIFLFESKDVLIKEDIKISFDYKKLEEALIEKFYFQKTEKRKKPKAVLQLIRNIKQVLSYKIPRDTSYKVKNVVIYPILVTHSRQFDVLGLNIILNEWFAHELSENDIDSNRVMPITIINIDEFIYLESLFSSKKIVLEKLINDYHKSCKFDWDKKYKNEEERDAYARATLLPFEGYLNNYLRRKKLIANPKILREMGLSLFEK